MPTSASDSNAARAWVAMRLVDGIRQGGLDAFYDGYNVKVNGEHIDLGSVVSAVTAKPHKQWASVVNTFAASVVSRLVDRGGTVRIHSTPLGNLTRTRTAAKPRFVDVSTSGQRAAKVTTARASSLAGALELRPLPEPSLEDTPGQDVPRPDTATADVEAIEVPSASELFAVIDLTEPPTLPIDQPIPQPTELVPQPTVAVEPLATALAAMEYRVVADDLSADVPAEAKGASPVSDTSVALSVGDSWVTDADLAAWGIDRSMATEVVSSRVRTSGSATVQLISDSGCRLFVIETESREIVATVCHLDQYVPVRADESVWVALGGERVAIVALDEVLSSAAVSLLVDSALAESAASSSRLRPSLYRWTDGELCLEVADLDTAAGRVAARARMTMTSAERDHSNDGLVLV